MIIKEKPFKAADKTCVSIFVVKHLTLLRKRFPKGINSKLSFFSIILPAGISAFLHALFFRSIHKCLMMFELQDCGTLGQTVAWALKESFDEFFVYVAEAMF